ncbi:MAG TPA: DUF6691 family protein [Pseudomonadales bacterium]|nr:DUF6691 family protein [Pseudomonadales bacterium]
MQRPSSTLTGHAAALAAGTLFGLGLAISQMVDPNKVLSFLDIGALPYGAWDPSLLLVLGAAVAVNLVGYRFVLKRANPLFDTRFHVPDRSDIDGRLLGGAALFGIGWGLAGYCPGPAIAALTLGSADPLWFAAAMIAGMVAHDGFGRRRAAAAA